MDKKKTAQGIFTFLVTALFLYVLSPLIMPVVFGGILGILVYPIFEKLNRYRWPRAVNASLITTLVTILVLVPTVLIIVFGIQVAVEELGSSLTLLKVAPHKEPGISIFENILTSRPVERILELIERWIPVNIEEVVQSLTDLLQVAGVKVANFLGDFIAKTPAIVMALSVVVVCLFFVLLDGRRWLNWLRENSIFTPAQTEAFIRRFEKMSRSVFLSFLISGLVQALVFSLACVIFGVSRVPLIGFGVFLMSFLPVVGSMPITIPIAVYQILAGGSAAGIVLAIVAVIVLFIDNLIRPIVLKGAGGLHPLLAFLSVFGGMVVFGLGGVFLGPIIAGIFVLTLDTVQSSRRA